MSKFQTVFIIITALFCAATVAVNVSLLPSDIISYGTVSNSSVASVESHDEYPVNLNTATIADLVKLPDIGETRAQAIIEYRELHGGFFTKEEVMNVKGIGESIYNGIKDLIAV